MLAVILSKIFDYLADHTGEVIDLIKEAFDCSSEKVESAIEELKKIPTAESLVQLQEALEEDGQDTEQLAKILVNTATV